MLWTDTAENTETRRVPRNKSLVLCTIIVSKNMEKQSALQRTKSEG